MSTIFARLDGQGTAAAETALCADHLNRAAEFGPDLGYGRDVAVTEHVETTNEALSCQVCGLTIEDGAS